MKRLRAFLLICLMLTVPLQAMAGKVLLCESFHATVSSAAEVGKTDMHAHHTNSPGHEHHGQAPHELSAAASDISHADHHAAMMEDPASEENHSGSCNMCSSCPVGSVAMTMVKYSVPPSDPVPGGVFHFSFHIPEFAPDLPDDPPRA
jgi:hypothetical protein